QPTDSTIPGLIARLDAQHQQETNGNNPPPTAAPAPVEPTPEPVEPAEAENALRRICGARGKRSGKPCQRAPMANGRCPIHGGKTPVGVAASRFKHGRYSKHLPQGLRNKYKAALSDPRLTSLKDELAIQVTRLNQLFEALD